MSKSSASTGWSSDAPTPAQLKEFFAQIGNGRITKGRLQEFLRGKTEKTVAEWKEEWKSFYRKCFGTDVDLSDVAIPECRAEFDCLIIVAQGLTLNGIYDICAKHFSCRRYTDDLNKAVMKNDRSPGSNSYAVWFRDRQEADEELKNLSADDLAEQGIFGITLMERMLYELKYWDETGKHLDLNNWTLCSGSRSSDGDVPNARWFDGEFEIGWSYSDNRYDDLRARAAIPCPA